MTSKRDWTILLYMGGDNGKIFETDLGAYALMAEMTTAGHRDIAEIQEVGSTDRVAVLAQFDTLGEDPDIQQGSYRLEIRQGNNTWDDVVEVIPEINTGDPCELARFVIWGMARCPARHTLLILWNHGIGWKDNDVYQTVRSGSHAAALNLKPRSKNVAFFSATADWARKLGQDIDDDLLRGILYDDTSLDFLTNVELSQALRVAEIAESEDDAAAIFADPTRLEAVMSDHEQEPQRQLSAIGMDACLMAMIEVFHQVRDFAAVAIASQELEPLNGWPYTGILEKLNGDPEISPRQLGILIVEEYGKAYQSRPITQSAVDLTTMKTTAHRVGNLARAITEIYPDESAFRRAYQSAADTARGIFEDPDYVDLHHFVTLLRRHYLENGGMDLRLLATSTVLRDWIASSRGPVVSNVATGKYAAPRATGLSIYLPASHAPYNVQPSPAYKELDFADTGWLEMLETIYQTA
ncbi:MAG: clostripain-related cysteine peptidase [Chloroflexota bacterium]|nr:clostripain-related cysteine peptidase [Chloroflexota bacterium]